MKKIMFLSLFVTIGFISGFLTSVFSEPVADYHIECIGNEEVKLMDINYKEIKATTIDSIGYYIIDDNI